VNNFLNLCLEQLTTKKSKEKEINDGIPFNLKKNFKILKEINQEDKIIEIQNNLKKIEEIHSHLENVFGKFQTNQTLKF
jgi:hypothetical protein